MNMIQKVMIPAAMVLALATASSAQLGVKAGLGMSLIHGDSNVEHVYDGYLASPMVGLTYHLTLGPIGFKPEVMVVRKGASGSVAGVDNSISAWYVDAPLLGSFTFFPSLSVIAGPSVGYFLTGTYKMGSESHKMEDVAPINIGAVVGLQFMLPIAGLGVDARYQRGFTTMDDNGDFDMMSDAFAVTATYLF